MKPDMARVKYVIFDMDNTLWDFKAAATAVVGEYARQLGQDPYVFAELFHLYNHQVWRKYEAGLLSKEQLQVRRFEQLLRSVGIDEPKAAYEFNAWFIKHYIEYPAEVPGSRQCLERLHGRFPMAVLSNGFNPQRKVATQGFEGFFERIISSSDLGVPKPEPQFFLGAAAMLGVVASQCLYIGDDIKTDYYGAVAVGMQAVWYSAGRDAPKGEEIVLARSLDQIPELLNV